MVRGFGSRIDALAKELQSQDPLVRSQAAAKLGATHDARAICPLVTATEDGDLRVRTVVAAALLELDRAKLNVLGALSAAVNATPPARPGAAMTLERLEGWRQNEGR